MPVGVDLARLEANVTHVIADGVALLDSEARLAVNSKRMHPSLVPSAHEPSERLRQIASQLRKEADLLDQGDLWRAQVLVRDIDASYIMMRKCREQTHMRDRIPSHPLSGGPGHGGLTSLVRHDAQCLV